MTIDWTKEVEARKDDLLGRFTKTYYGSTVNVMMHEQHLKRP